jgi:hypothetical protein
MKKILPGLVVILFLSTQLTAQNVGVNTTTPEAALDVNGDVIFRTGDLIVADGITLALDVTSTKFSYYRITGPVADFTLAGITAGVDGRLLTLFNRSGFVMQLNNEDPSASATDQIMTGTDANMLIPFKGVINLQYDATEQKWIVKSSSKGLPAILPGGLWDLNGSDIYNNNTGNVGIGTTTPINKLTIATGFNTTGWTHIATDPNVVNPIIVGETVGGVSAALGVLSEHTLRLTAGVLGKIQMYPTGDVVVGDNTVPGFGRFTVSTPNNSYGISHTSPEGNILATRIGGTSAGIGTFTNTNMRLFVNGTSAVFISSGTNNVGIGIEFPANKLEVNGVIRSKEVLVEAINWPDYVFSENYKLPLLNDLEKFIRQNKHLPNIPSAATIETNGLLVGDTQKKMMEKIEELTLYIIELNKKVEQLEKASAAGNTQR